MNRKARKLSLNKDTIRILTDSEMGAARGGKQGAAEPIITGPSGCLHATCTSMYDPCHTMDCTRLCN